MELQALLSTLKMFLFILKSFSLGFTLNISNKQCQVQLYAFEKKYFPLSNIYGRQVSALNYGCRCDGNGELECFRYHNSLREC